MTRSAMFTSKDKRRGMSRWMMTATTILTVAVAATVLVQSTSATATINTLDNELVPRQLGGGDNLFENADVMVKRLSSSISAEHASWIKQALSLAGTYSPTVSTIAGKQGTTSSAKTTSTTAKTTSTSTKKTTSTTAKTTSTSTIKTTSSTAKTTSTSTKRTTMTTTSATPISEKATVYPATSSSVKSTSKSVSTTATSAVFPTASTKKVTTTSTAKPKTETWSWAAAAYGCGTSSASGNLLYCYATGTVQDNQRRSPEATAAPNIESRDFYNKRVASDNGDTITTPDFGWLDTIVGAVPYRKGDFISSIVWAVLTCLLVPMFIFRAIRRSSLVAPSLLCVFIWIGSVIAAFAIRAWMATNTPTSQFIIAENVLLQLLPCLLLEPLLKLLTMYSTHDYVKSAVPSVCIVLRIVNVAAFALFTATATYTSRFINQWDDALMSSTTSAARDAFPAYSPAAITRLGPIIASFLMLAVIAAGLLLIPIARGTTGSVRPGGFLAALFTLIGVSVAYRVLQSLHAQSIITNDANTEAELSSSATDIVSTALLQLASSSTSNIVKIADIAPPGMFFSSNTTSVISGGIAWANLQSTMASRGIPQSPVIFNLVYILPMWLQVFMLFFVHAPGGSANSKYAALEASA